MKGESGLEVIHTFTMLYLRTIGSGYLHQQGIDTSTPAGKAMFQMLGVFAEFERSMIREWVMCGIDRAKAQGKKIGRPRVDNGVETQIRKLRADGLGIRKIALQAGCGISVVQRVIKAA